MAAREQGIVPAGRRYDAYDAIYDADRYDDHEPVLKRRRADGLHFETYEYSFGGPRGVEYRLLEEENMMLRKRVEDLKKQVNNLLATNEVLLEQNAQFRNQAKVMTLSSTPAATEQTLAPTVGTVTNYNHSIAQTHTTLSSQALQPRPVSQQDLVAPAGAQAAPPANAAPPHEPRDHPAVGRAGADHRAGHGPPRVHGAGGRVGGAGGRVHGAAAGGDHHEPRHHPHGDVPHRLAEHAHHGHATLTPLPARGTDRQTVLAAPVWELGVAVTPPPGALCLGLDGGVGKTSTGGFGAAPPELLYRHGRGCPRYGHGPPRAGAVSRCGGAAPGPCPPRGPVMFSAIKKQPE
ncbi:hypothetical protein Q9966_016407, partial [Columba livia]